MKTLRLVALVGMFALPALAGEFALGPSGQERIVAADLIDPDAGWTDASYDATNCMGVHFSTTRSWSDNVGCGAPAAQVWTAKGVWLTAIRVLVTDALADTSDGSCEFRLTTSAGTSAISGTVLDAGPGSGNAMAEGTVYEVKFNHRLAAGSSFQIEARNGSQCASETCECGDFGDQHVSVWGRY